MKKLFIVTFLILSGCTGLDEFLTPGKNADQHYLDCRATNYDFVEVVKCGRTARYAACRPSSCSVAGTGFVTFANNLANDVTNNVLSQEEAYRYLYLGIQAFNANLQSQNAASSAALINLGAAISGGGTIGSPSASSRPTGYLKSQVVSGTNRICYYNVMGSTKTLNVRASSACPISYKF